jgi:phosphopentomutase
MMNIQLLKSLVDNHHTLEGEIIALDERRNILINEKEKTDKQLFSFVNKIKGKEVKVGDEIIKIETFKEVIAAKTTYKYKEILNKLLDEYVFEKRYIARLFKKFGTVKPKSTNTIKNLTITKIEKKVK